MKSLDEALQEIFDMGSDLSQKNHEDLINEIIESPLLKNHLVCASARSFLTEGTNPIQQLTAQFTVFSLGVMIGRKQLEGFFEQVCTCDCTSCVTDNHKDCYYGKGCPIK